MKPKKPFKNIQDARKQMAYNAVIRLQDNEGFWPCLSCNGNGLKPTAKCEDSWGKWIGFTDS